MDSIIMALLILSLSCLALAVEKREASPQFQSFPATITNNQFQDSQTVSGQQQQLLAQQRPIPAQQGQAPGQQVSFPGQQRQALGPQGQIPGQQIPIPGQQFPFPGQRQAPGPQGQIPGQQKLPPGQQVPFPGQQRQIPGQQTVNLNSLSLTDRQRLAILQGHSGRNQGLGGLRPAFENQAPFSGNGIGQGNHNQFLEQARKTQFPGQFNQARPTQQQQNTQQFSQSFAQRPQQFAQSIQSQLPQPARDIPVQHFAQAQNLGAAGSLQQVTQAQQQFPSTPQQTQSSQSHPEKFLNQLSPEQKQQFLNQFDQLTQEQQAYAYNKFLSTPAEVQQFAINQFLSLDSQVLAVSLQEEIRKEQQQQGLVGQQFSSQPLPQTQQSFPQGQQQLPQGPQQQQFTPNPQQPEASAADKLALQQQQEALQKIIDLQNSINFPNGK